MTIICRCVGIVAGVSINFSQAVQGGNTRIGFASRELNASLERLATGKRINRASDDVVGMQQVTELDGQIKSLSQRIKSAERQAMRMQAREGAESEFGEAFVQMQSLLTAAANRGALSDEERSALQVEFDSLLDGLQFISNTFVFDGQQMFAGRDVLREGAQQVDIAGEAVDVSLKDLQRGGKLNLVDGDLDLAQRVLDSAKSQNLSVRGAAGSMSKQLQSQLESMRIEMEELTGVKSQIEDTDYAKETANLVRQQILQQASMQTRQMGLYNKRDTVLALLRGVAV